MVDRAVRWLHGHHVEVPTWRRKKKGHLSTPESVPHSGSTNCWWNRWGVQILARFSVRFLGPRLRRPGAACRRLLVSPPRASWAHNGQKSMFVLWARQVHRRLVTEAKAIHANREVCAMAHSEKKGKIELGLMGRRCCGWSDIPEVKPPRPTHPPTYPPINQPTSQPTSQPKQANTIPTASPN